ALASFKADLTVCVPDISGKLPKALESAGTGKYIIRAGSEMKGAPWPEFAPIWQQEASSRVSVLAVGGDEVGAINVHVGKEDTSISLRAKHAEAAAQLVAALVDGGVLPKAEKLSPFPDNREAPKTIGLDWPEDTVDRFVRASIFPPHDPAVIEDPATKETYFIENMEQYQQFRIKVLDEGKKEGVTQKSYAADTHWYSNVGGSIVKMGDSDIHMPLKTADKKHKAIIPGAAIGSRKKLRMNEPLIG
ncbi:unnamed protein product, partial [Polarella glacialis]